MSATGIHITPNQIILASDGMAMLDDKVHASDNKKIHKLNEHIGFCWLGLWSQGLQNRICWQIDKINSVMGAATKAGQILKEQLEGSVELEAMPIWMLFAGYEKGELKGAAVYTMLNDGDPFTPIAQPLFHGLTGAKLYCIDSNQLNAEAVFQQLLQTNLPLYHPNAEHAVKVAFGEMIKGCEGQGYNVGGEIYTEVIKR